MKDAGEERLKELFNAVRKEDSVRLPSFEKMTDPAGCRPRKMTFTPLFFAAASFVLIAGFAALAALIILPGRRATAPADGDGFESWSSFSGYQASSDSLLSLSSTAWETSMTTPTDSLLGSSAGQVGEE